MTRWVHYGKNESPTLEYMGSITVGDTEVEMSTMVRLLTNNMYGETTPTHNLRLKIQNKAHESGKPRVLDLPGKLERGYVIRHSNDYYLLLILLKEEYISPGSNAQGIFIYRFIVHLPSVNCWNDKKRKDGLIGFYEGWEPWETLASIDSIPDEVLEYAELEPKLDSMEEIQEEERSLLSILRQQKINSLSSCLIAFLGIIIYTLDVVIGALKRRFLAKRKPRLTERERIEKLLNTIEVKSLRLER